ncbi:MAG: hypothetical protein ACRCYU_20915 [Nocardioides sp.]
MNDTRPLPRLSDYSRYTRRHWRRLVGLSVLGALIGAVVFFSIPTRFLATSRIALSPQISYLSLSPLPEKQPLVTLDTTAGLVRSDFAVRKIAEAVRGDETDVRRDLTISAQPLSRVLVIQLRADTNEQARAGAHAATEALIGLQAEKFALGDGRVRALKTRVAVLDAQAQEALTDGLPSDGLFDSVQVLQQKLDRAVATNNTRSQVINRARIVQYRPGEAEVFVSGGLTAGLCLALITAGPARPTSGPQPASRRFARRFARAA